LGLESDFDDMNTTRIAEPAAVEFPPQGVLFLPEATQQTAGLKGACMDTADAPGRSPGNLAARWNVLRRILPGPLLVLRKDGLILDFLTPFQADGAWRNVAFTGRNMREFILPTRQKEFDTALAATLANRAPQTLTTALESREGSREVHLRLAADGLDEVLALLESSAPRRISEREVAEITQREQIRIGQDLHDGLGQHLTGITFLTRALVNKLTAQGLPEAAEAAEIGRLVFQALSQTRNLARGLLPVELESQGLRQALAELAANVRDLYQIDCGVEWDADLSISDRSIASQLFRLAQEAINNSIKHGEARHVRVALRKLHGQCCLLVRDDGTGLAKRELRPNGLGLRIMNYRAQRLGGSLRIQPGEHGGTVVTCLFPCPPESDAPSKAEPSAK
jgi:signal transduction histidine kinase